MKKTIFIFSIIVISFLSFNSLKADSDVSLESVLSEIKTSQNTSELNQIKCEKVSDEQFEKLGDAVMSIMHPDEKEHELMDKMMGGEGSDSLKAMHIIMGKRYLSCGSQTGMGGGMMGYGGNYSGGMMGSGMMGGGGMMGYGYPNMMGGNYFYGWNWFGILFQILILVLLITGIVALLKWLSKQK